MKEEYAMKYTTSDIELQNFFPEELIVTRVEGNNSAVDSRMWTNGKPRLSSQMQ